MAVNKLTGRQRQRGTFVIECALVLGVLVLLIGFTSDIISWQAVYARLQRMAHSGATLIRERELLFADREVLTNDDVQKLYQITRQSLTRTYGDFAPGQLGLYVEQVERQYPSGQWSSVAFHQGSPCRPARTLKGNSRLFPADQSLIIYQVTVCYPADSYYQALLGNGGVLIASTLMPGR
ncbi:tight adherence pilus pseudopilin TadF [Parendozoicomonas haliclonae]|uniref:TadE-like protein n=1 Tax=Parendozoicomonas haliclonae TaxID=1960125 RepID=A0A1X7AKU6_9GAMM|nr:tight adherence pilus pseudopilin TadF [Parendozoicomonas haliclonae]SMA47552.1 hypothetical protein EHSB41UT_02459 [Parendozoicomonas haliclonae]